MRNTGLDPCHIPRTALTYKKALLQATKTRTRTPSTTSSTTSSSTTFFFTFQGGESIDFTWSRYKVNKKILKIKSAELEDTGVFGCKGINGFGSDAVRLELIIVGKENDVMRIRDNTRVAIWPFETVYQN